jgi:hypothetical protein
MLAWISIQYVPYSDSFLHRSASHSSLRGPARRSHNRQPSPEYISSQAEGANQSTPSHQHSKSLSERNPSHLFDPFLASSDTDSNSDSSRPQIPVKPMILRAAPQLASRPNGKLARRRQSITQASFSPSPPSRAVPVTRTNFKSHTSNLSRSEPLPSHMPSRAISKRSSVPLIQWEDFPVCDDMNNDVTPPSTPTRVHRSQVEGNLTWQQTSTYDDGPRTAPLLSTTSFPFGGYRSVSPTPSPTTRRHQRTPSDGVFTMLFDEDIPASQLSEDVTALFSTPLKRQSSPGSLRLSKDKAGYFASSMFQNSPDPEELPPPSFGMIA